MKIKKLVLPALAFLPLPSLADTAIETETAQIGKQDDIAISQSLQYEKAKDGVAYGTLTQFEYGISDRAEILIEPFFREWIKPDDEASTSGRGDLEITPSYMVIQEGGAIPAVLLALKIKVPTGSEEVEGTRKYDYYPYLIFGQHYGGWTFNANLGVNYANSGDKTDNPIQDNGSFDKKIVWDLEAETELAPDLTGFFEVFSAEEGIKTVSTALEYKITKNFNAFVSLGYDEEDTVILRPGFNLEF